MPDLYNDDAEPDWPDEFEMAYFVGSLDTFDLEFGELVANAREMAGSIPAAA